MYYELYLDVLFLVNFMMDYILLLLVRKVVKSSATLGYICLGALTGAALACAVTLVPLPSSFVKFVLFHLVINILMVRIGLRLPWNRKLLKGVLVLYAAGFLTGGVFEYFHQYVEVGSLFFALSIVCYYIVSAVFWLLSGIWKLDSYQCEVELRQGTQVLKVPALMDTGNRLRDKLTGKPVSIIERPAAMELFAGKFPEGLRYIPCHTIGKKRGVIPVVTLDRLKILDEGEEWIEHPLVGITGESVTEDGEYRMILHPDV